MCVCVCVTLADDIPMIVCRIYLRQIDNLFVCRNDEMLFYVNLKLNLCEGVCVTTVVIEIYEIGPF